MYGEHDSEEAFGNFWNHILTTEVDSQSDIDEQEKQG